MEAKCQWTCTGLEFN